MLCISRKPGERILIATNAGNVTIWFDEIRGKKAQVRFEAPASVVILRGEIYDAITREGKPDVA